MNLDKGLVLDANILIRAVLGRRVLQLLIKYRDAAAFCCPDRCFDDARKYLPSIGARRKLDSATALETLDKLNVIVQPIPRSVYSHYEGIARERVEMRDPNDWPVAALALVLGLPIWTEDPDFFGSGIATWTTDRVELYLRP